MNRKVIDLKIQNYEEMKMKKLQELKQEFLNFPIKEKSYTNEERKYIVVSHFVGNKDINEVLKRLAIKQAYNEI